MTYDFNAGIDWSDGTDPSDEINNAFKRAKADLFIGHPFYGAYLAGMYTQEINSKSPPHIQKIRNIGTDGVRIWWRREFIEKLDAPHRTWAIAKQIIHSIFNHINDIRKQDRDPMAWQASSDYVATGILDDEEIGERPDEKTCPTLYDKNYKGKYVEELYNLLAEKWQIIGSGDGDGKGGVPGDIANKLFDDRVEPQSDAERNAIQDKVNSMIHQAWVATGGEGLSDLMKRMLNDFLDPKINWKDYLHNTIPSLFKKQHTWKRPHKRSFAYDLKSMKSGMGTVIWPSRKRNEKVDIDIFIDVSGSINEQMIVEMLSEIKGMMQYYTDFKIRVHQFDTQVFGSEVFSRENLDDITKLAEYKDAKIGGGGGTSFNCIFNHLIDENRVPHQLIVMTDLYPFDGFGPKDYCRCVWLVYGDYQKQLKADWGVTVHYETDVPYDGSHMYPIGNMNDDDDTIDPSDLAGAITVDDLVDE